MRIIRLEICAREARDVTGVADGAPPQQAALLQRGGGGAFSFSPPSWLHGRGERWSPWPARWGIEVRSQINAGRGSRGPAHREAGVRPVCAEHEEETHERSCRR